MEKLEEKHSNASEALQLLERDIYEPERNILSDQNVRFVELLYLMAKARDSYYMLEPLLTNGNLLALILLTLLLLLLLVLLAALAYWLTPKYDCRLYI